MNEMKQKKYKLLTLVTSLLKEKLSYRYIQSKSENGKSKIRQNSMDG